MKLKKQLQLSLMAVAILFTTGCANTKPHPAISQTEMRLEKAEADIEVKAHARQSLEQARNALSEAKEAWRENEKESQVNHLSYIASRKIDLAHEVTRKQLAEEVAKDRRNLAELRARAKTLETAVAKNTASVNEAAATHYKQKYEEEVQ